MSQCFAPSKVLTMRPTAPTMVTVACRLSCRTLTALDKKANSLTAPGSAIPPTFPRGTAATTPSLGSCASVRLLENTREY